MTPVFDRSQKADRGHALEVAVFNELLRRGAEAAYVKTKSGFEVDFYVREADGRRSLIQVCDSIDEASTREREARALQEAATSHPCEQLLILTAESRAPFPPLPKPIRALPAWQWMLQAESA